MKKLTALVIASSLLTACGGDSSDKATTDNNDSNTTTRDTSSFPVGLAINSPTSTEDVSNILSRSMMQRATTSFHASATARIEALLNGTTPLRSIFTPNLLYRNVTDATCFGPQLKYSEHPDGTSGNSGDLPTGDLGLWQETNGSNGEACAAAQLNAQMQGIRDRSMAGLMMTASTVSALYAAGKSLPAEGVTETLTSQMNATSIPSVTFNSVTLEHKTGDYAYDITFTYTKGSKTYTNVLHLKHEPNVSNQYRGILTYKIQDEFTGGTCGTGTHDITRVGSLAYDRSSDTFKIESREAQFCGHSVANGFDSTNQVDPADRYDATTNSDGWGNNFSIFKAEYDKTDLSGKYAYIWQAGPNDPRSRVFRIGLNSSTTSEDGSINADGEAWYGYGAMVDDTSATQGAIQGFICNWAGPGHVNTVQDYAQRQFLNYDSTAGVYTPVTGGTDITYAPTNSCKYDGSGSFAYDRNLDNTLDSNDKSKVVDTVSDSATEVEFDLYYPKGAYATAGNSVPEIIELRSSLPTAPTLP